AEKRCQILAIHIFHREEVMTIDFSNVINTANVGMGNTAGSADLIMKAFKKPLIVYGLVGQELQSNRLTQCEVIGTINFSHSATPEQSDNAVTSREQNSRQKQTLISRGRNGT